MISNRDVLVRSLAGWFGVAAFILLMIVHLTGGDSALLARFTLASLAGLITPAFGEGDSLILFGGVLAGPLISVLINLGLFRIVKGAPRSLYVFSAGGMSVLWHSIGAGELFASV